MMTLNELARIADGIDGVALDETGDTLTLIVSGGEFVSNLSLERAIWCSEDDEREQDADGEYTETVKEYTLRMLGQLASDINATVELVRALGEE